MAPLQHTRNTCTLNICLCLCLCEWIVLNAQAMLHENSITLEISMVYELSRHKDKDSDKIAIQMEIDRVNERVNKVTTSLRVMNKNMAQRNPLLLLSIWSIFDLWTNLNLKDSLQNFSFPCSQRYAQMHVVRTLSLSHFRCTKINKNMPRNLRWTLCVYWCLITSKIIVNTFARTILQLLAATVHACFAAVLVWFIDLNA